MMSRRIAIEGSFAASEAVKMASVDVVAAYPITPQTRMVERLADIIAGGELNAIYIPVESEHSAMAACSGAAAVGARTFTASCGQGFMYMQEVLYWVSILRQPIVMALTNRAVGPPNTIWCDHSDAMIARDTGWIQIFASNNQEVFDLVLTAFRIAEDPDVLLPVMVHLDGFTLSHTVEPVVLPDQKEVDKFLPRKLHPFAMHPDTPTTYVHVLPPDLYSEGKMAQDASVRESKEGILRAWKEFGNIFGRYYSPIERYKIQGAKTLLLCMGSVSETAKLAIDKKREKGEDVGLLILRLWRPFPFEEFYDAIKDAEILIAFDRCISPGGPGGPVCSELKSALFGARNDIKCAGIIGGLGGRNLGVEQFENVIDKGEEIAIRVTPELFQTIDIRG